MHAARPDANSHFTIADEYTPEQQRKSNRGARFDQDPLQDGPVAAKRTNMDSTKRGGDLGAHFSTSGSPSASGKENSVPTQAKIGKVRNDLESHWGFGTPEPEPRGYKTAGDGMGGRAGARSWGIGDDSDPEYQADVVRRSARSRSGRTATQAQAGAGDY